MENQIILQGITLEQFYDGVRAIVREELDENGDIYQLSKAEACRRLKICHRTLIKRMGRENITKIYNTDLHKLEK